MIKITEQPSPHRDLQNKTVAEITALINSEDKKVAVAIEAALPAINRLIEEIVKKMKAGGRMFYLGAGSGGRLSVLDAIELPTTYGVSKDLVQAVLAGGVEHLVEALEQMEDDTESGWQMLKEKSVSPKDVVIGITASGTTPFVVEALKQCRSNGITTACVTGNPQSEVARHADIPVEVITGPEFITGSTRMKCGTAQKMIFDMISTTVMIKLDRVIDNRMVHVSLINNKITDRAVKMVMEMGKINDYEKAKQQLMKYGSVKDALDHVTSNAGA
jgi:N-acetylmuramic acid 6-phosphate etherase